MTKKPKKIYISGKISDMPYEEAFNNFLKAEHALKQIGFEVVNPMKLDHKNAVTWSDYMRTDIKALMDCDNIFMLSNWRKSEGAKLEKHIADALEIKEFCYATYLLHLFSKEIANLVNYCKQVMYN